MVALEEIEMPKLSLMFDNKIMKEVPVGSRPVTIGRSPDNDLPVDNLAVSNYHAKIYFEAGRMVIEDLDSLNGTFVNDLRVERATLHDGDNIHIGKHKIKVDTSGFAAGVPGHRGLRPQSRRAAHRRNHGAGHQGTPSDAPASCRNGRIHAVCLVSHESPDPSHSQWPDRSEGVCSDQQTHGHWKIRDGHRSPQGLVQASDGRADQSAR